MLSKNLTSKKPSSSMNNCSKQNNPLSINSFVYGQPTKKRCQEPTMYEILSWGGSQSFIRKDYYTENQHNNDTKSYLRDEDNFYCQKYLSSVQRSDKIIKGNNNKMQNIHKIQNEEYLSTTKKPKFHQDVNQENFKRTNITNNKKQQCNHKLNKKSINQFKNYLKIKKAHTDTNQPPRYLENKKTLTEKLIQTQKIDPYQFDKLQKQAIKKFKQTTRDLSNTSFLTYFNKPPFENYGRGNKNKLGVLYGDYMYSYSVYPHTGDNKPYTQQSYGSALARAQSAQNIRPHPILSRTLQENLTSGYLTLSNIHPKKSQIDSLPIKFQTKLQNLPQFNIRKDKNDNKFHQEYLNQLQQRKKQSKKQQKQQNKLNQYQSKPFMSGKPLKYKKRL